MSRFLGKLYGRYSKPSSWNWNVREPRSYEYRVSWRSRSSQCQDSPRVSTRIAVPVDYERVVDFMRNSYFKTEPSLVNIGLTCQEEPPSVLVDTIRRNVKEGMTIIAEGPDNCVVGAAINFCTSPWYAEKMIEFAECCCEHGPVRDIIKFYAHVMSEPKLWQRYDVQRVFECSCVSVDDRYLGKGIGRRLVKESWYLARDCGYPVFRMDCTSK